MARRLNWEKRAFDLKRKRALKDEEEFRKTDWAARFIARAEQSPRVRLARSVCRIGMRHKFRHGQFHKQPAQVRVWTDLAGHLGSKQPLTDSERGLWLQSIPWRARLCVVPLGARSCSLCGDHGSLVGVSELASELRCLSQRRCDRGREIVSGACNQPHAGTIAPGHDAEAVMLDFV